MTCQGAPAAPRFRVMPASDRVLAEVAALVATCPTPDGCAACSQAVADLAELERLAGATWTTGGRRAE